MFGGYSREPVSEYPVRIPLIDPLSQTTRTEVERSMFLYREILRQSAQARRVDTDSGR
jgi:hypothetical protein